MWALERYNTVGCVPHSNLSVSLLDQVKLSDSNTTLPTKGTPLLTRALEPARLCLQGCMQEQSLERSLDLHDIHLPTQGSGRSTGGQNTMSHGGDMRQV